VPGRADGEGRQRIAQLERDLAEAREQQTATSDLLEVIGRSDFRLEPVFQTAVRHAVRICRADCGYVYQPEGDVYRVAFILGGAEDYQEYMRRHPVAQGPETLVGRVGLERRIVHLPDVLADPSYHWPIGRELGGYRTMLGAPMLAGDRVVGVLILWRLAVDPFDERTISLLNTLAAQVSIAIQNAELFELGEISQAVSSTLDLDEVLTTIVARAAQLSGTEGGSIYEYEAASGRFVLRTCVGTDPELMAQLSGAGNHIDDTFLGRVARSGGPLQAPDLSREPPDPHLEALAAGGWRSMLAVPLLWDGQVIGALLVRRKLPGRFPTRTGELLETLASQSAVAIHNARTYHELQERSRQLEIASQHKSEFLASMSHELRTPLNAVIGFSEVLLERMFGDLNERQDEYLRDIRDSGRHLLELINEILDLSKVEAGRMDLELADVAVRPLLEHGLAMLRERAGRGGVTLTLEAPDDLGEVRADELKLTQVTLNLLTNAIKFTPSGGAVRVRARRTADELEIEVGDTGVGIAEDEQERIFDAFQRGGRSARTSTEGTGLGLTLSRRFVELHGGRMWMESTPGSGSTFGFAIPVGAAVDDSPAPPAPAGAPPAAGDARTVVVIDDDPLELDLVEAVLTPEGFDVVRAGNGDEGVELVRHRRPGVVLLDLLMPDMDGFAVVETLRAEPATADVPIVVLTHKELTRADRYRLSGRINHLAQKGELDRAGLVALVGRLASPRVAEGAP
jgi:signal transduction histidine kinase/CheY-like chemotaxis protein